MRWKSDPLWCEALAVAKSLSLTHKYIVVPEEFFKYRENFWPLQEVKQLAISEITAFVIEKDKCGLFPNSFWREQVFGRFHCVFANEVFVAYSSLDEDSAGEPEQIKKHIPTFLEYREKILGRASSEAVQDELPYLLDTQKNRILKEMFPNHHYAVEQFEDLSNEPLQLREAVFKYCVNTVNIEISEFCNRNCPYCPVSQSIKRKNQNSKIDLKIFERCIRDLESIDYSGILSFTLFNEPLFDRDLFMKCLQYSREHLPKSYIRIHTNGDYLTTDYLAEIAEKGATEIGISVHYSGEWQRDEQLSKIYTILDRIGIGNRGNLTEDDNIIIFYVDKKAYNSTSLRTVLFRTENFMLHGVDRGGTLNKNVRLTKNMDHCQLALEQFDVAYDGTILPCCSIFPEDVHSALWTYGNVSQYEDIFSAFTCGKAAAFRQQMFSPRTESEYTPDPCRSCAIAYLDGDERLYRLDDKLRREIFDSWLKK